MHVQVSSDLWAQPKALAMSPTEETHEGKDNRNPVDSNIQEP